MKLRVLPSYVGKISWLSNLVPGVLGLILGVIRIEWDLRSQKIMQAGSEMQD